MNERTGVAQQRKWYDSSHASLCLLGACLRRLGILDALADGLHLRQKTLKYSPAQKLVMLFAALLAGAKTVSQTGTTLRTDRALQAAFGLPGCADQSVIAATLDAATEADVADLRAVLGALLRQHSQACRHDYTKEYLLLDLDLSPLPASTHCEGATRGYMGRCRSRTGRKLVRVTAAAYQETVWEDVVPGRSVETLAVLQDAVLAAEKLLGLDGDDAATAAKRARTQWRLDSGWGSGEQLNWLLERGYQVTGKFTSTSRVKKLTQTVTAWEPTSNVGRDVGVVGTPVALARATQQYAVRTPAKKKPDGYQYAVLVSSRNDLSMQEVVDHYDGRAGIEAELKSDKRGLGLAGLRKHKLAAQTLVVLLMGLAHNVLVWSRRWLAARVPRLRAYGIVRLIQEVWAVPGRVKLAAAEVVRVRLQPTHPRARDLLAALPPLLAERQTLGFWR
jgi:Transposase DDE domain